MPISWDAVEAEDRFESWAELLQVLLHANAAGWVFRGQTSFGWGLTTRLERELESIPEGARYDAENRIIGFFKERARMYLSDVPEDGDVVGWLSLMQHYGAPTRLLDWTASPVVGCWFAYEAPADSGSEGRSLWALNASGCRAPFGSRLGFGYDHLGVRERRTYETKGDLDSEGPSKTELVDVEYPSEDFDRWESQNDLLRRVIREEAEAPLPLVPPRPDSRMIAQQGLFTLDAQLDGGIPHPFMWEFAPEQSTSLTKRVFLPDEWRTEALETLQRMGITADSLFPGLDGLGQAAGMVAHLSWSPSELVQFYV